MRRLLQLLRLRKRVARPYNRPAAVKYICPEHKNWRTESYDGGFCEMCGRPLVEMPIGAICECGAKFIFTRNNCGSCGRVIRAVNWATFADPWGGLSVTSQPSG